MKALLIPNVIRAALSDHGAALAVSVSSGKDSQAMLNAVSRARKQHFWKGDYFAIHADLGRAEHRETEDHVAKICTDADTNVAIVRRKDGADLVDYMKRRMDKLDGQDKPFWPSSAARYCTSDMKRGPIDNYLRKWEGLIISAEGIRAQESDARSKKPVVKVRTQISSVVYKNMTPEQALRHYARTGQGRLALTWNAILDWKIEEVWEACGTSVEDLQRRQSLYNMGLEEQALDGWPAHPAYVYGNERLSCVFCVLGSMNDLRVGARHYPELLREYAQMEEESGFTFRNNFRLADLLEEVPT